jgi:RND superfamily putative drug exporter
MFGKIGGFTVRYKVWIILAWVVAAALMYLLAPSLSEVGTMKESMFLPKDSESLRASELIDQYFPESQSTSTVSLVFYDPNKLSDTDMAYASQVKDWLASGETSFQVTNVVSVFDDPLLASRLVSPDGTTMLLNAGLEQAAFQSSSMDIAQEIRDHVNTGPQGLDIYVSGQVGVYADLFSSLTKSIELTTMITVILVIILLIIIYRSPVAALVPLATIGMAFLVARGALGFIGQAGVSIWSQLDAFLIVLVFGIGTDYCLFLVSRYREELGRSGNRIEAMKFTITRIGAVIGASALAVIVGLGAMAVARYQMIQTMGPVMGVAIFITLLAALTLAPSLASILGKQLFWPRHEDVARDKPAKPSRFWGKIAGFATGRPIIVSGIVIVLMLVPFFALPTLNRSFDQLAEIPAGSESVAGFRALENHFDIGEMDPLTATIVVPEGQKITDPAALAAISEISSDLLTVDGVVKVQSAVQPEGTGGTPAGLTVAGQLAGIGEGINASLSSAAADPSLLFSENVTAGFKVIPAYLGELAQNFSWVASEDSYRAVMADLTSINQTIDEVRQGALVENQLAYLSGQISNAGQSLSQPGATFSPESIGLFTALKGYLDELSAQYPEVKAGLGYQNAETILGNIGSALISAYSEKQQELLAKLPDYLQQLSTSFDKIADHFRGSNDILFSESLAALSTSPSPMDTLEAEFTSLSGDLRLLGARFEQNGNPIFFPASLMASSPEIKGLMDTFFSQDGRATRMYIVLDAYPHSDRALNIVGAARGVLKLSTAGSSLNKAEAVIGGTSAELADVRQVINTDFTRVLSAVIAAIFIVLVVLLRSVIAPLYLIITVLFSYGTTLGIISWIFEGIMGQDGISFMIPIIVFVLLIALGSDYNIFLMSRVREESATQPTRYGARLAAIATGGVITACGIILAGTFGVLVIAPIRTLMQIGAAVSIGVLIDTFLVRALLVPAIASLLGRWNWWPSKHG